MTEQQPPTFLQAGSHPAEGLRQMTASLLKDLPGVVEETNGGLEVVDGSSGMQVVVRKGRAFVAGTESGLQGMYHVTLSTDKTLTLSAGNASNARRDLIVARVYDTAYGSSSENKWAIEVVEGTPSGTPTNPAAPANSLKLASVLVAANASTISSGNIGDLRTFAGESGTVEEPASSDYSRGVRSIPGSTLTTVAAWSTWGSVLNLGAPTAGESYDLRFWASVSIEQTDGGGSHMANKVRAQYSTNGGGAWTTLQEHTASTNKGALDHAHISIAHFATIVPTFGVQVRLQRWKEKSNTAVYSSTELFGEFDPI